MREVRRSVRMALWLALACGLTSMAIAANGWTNDEFHLRGTDLLFERHQGEFFDKIKTAPCPDAHVEVANIKTKRTASKTWG